MSNNTILVTGGAGYIGSHTCLELLEAGYQVVVVDNLSNSKETALDRVRAITGKPLEFVRCDILDRTALDRVFTEYQPSAVIHFAGLKAVGESVEKPLLYYQNNVAGSAALLEAMAAAGVKNIVFSSSCTVYGTPETLPIREDFPLQAVNPYGQTKLTIENMLRDLGASDAEWNISILRYFNPVGAHPSGEIGEDPLGIPNNLMPYITQVAVGELRELAVFGDDYEPRTAPVFAITSTWSTWPKATSKPCRNWQSNRALMTHNLGTGQGCSVLEVIEGFRAATGKDIPYRIAGRRAGDAPAVYADPSLAASELGWKAQLGIEAMCADAWRWQQKNPKGY